MDDLFKSVDGFEWDSGNINKNWAKHKVSNLESEEVFLDESGLSGKDEAHSTNESRYKFLGVSKKGRYLTIIFTIRKRKLRIISARPMSKKDKIKYDKEKI